MQAFEETYDSEQDQSYLVLALFSNSSAGS